jgi:hypothetical protein
VITLRIRSQAADDLWFKMRMTQPLGKMFSAYCSRMGVGRNAQCFDFDGQVLRDYQTPGDLDMEDGDDVYAMTVRAGC